MYIKAKETDDRSQDSYVTFGDKAKKEKHGAKVHYLLPSCWLSKSAQAAVTNYHRRSGMTTNSYFSQF